MKQLIEGIPELDKDDPELKKLLEKKEDDNKDGKKEWATKYCNVSFTHKQSL